MEKDTDNTAQQDPLLLELEHPYEVNDRKIDRIKLRRITLGDLMEIDGVSGQYPRLRALVPNLTDIAPEELDAMDAADLNDLNDMVNNLLVSGKKQASQLASLEKWLTQQEQ